MDSQYGNQLQAARYRYQVQRDRADSLELQVRNLRAQLAKQAAAHSSALQEYAQDPRDARHQITLLEQLISPEMWTASR